METPCSTVQKELAGEQLCGEQQARRCLPGPSPGFSVFISLVARAMVSLQGGHFAWVRDVSPWFLTHLVCPRSTQA